MKQNDYHYQPYVNLFLHLCMKPFEMQVAVNVSLAFSSLRWLATPGLSSSSLQLAPREGSGRPPQDPITVGLQQFLKAPPATTRLHISTPALLLQWEDLVAAHQV